MKLFFHHVGQDGAKRDFPKTVFSQVDIQTVEENIPSSNPYRNELLNRLKKSFPSEKFNCWGVPSGAKNVMDMLEPGDVVLLVQSSSMQGTIPALCPVRVYLPHNFHELSVALWGEHKFPRIFFFDTEELDFLWIHFRDDVGYAEKFRPSGNFYSVRDDRLESFGGPAGYVQYLRINKRRIRHDDELSDNLDSELPNSTPDEVQAILQAMSELTNEKEIELTDSQQQFTSKNERLVLKHFVLG